MAKPELTAKQTRFIDEYLVDCNATAAAIRAGYSPRTARVMGHENLTKPDIKQRIDERMAVAADDAQYGTARWLAAGIALAESDVRRLFSPDAQRMLDPWEWDDATAQAVSSIEVDEIAGPDGARIGARKKIRFWNKVAARDQLAKHLGLYEADNRQQVADFGYHDLPLDKLRDIRAHLIAQGITIEGAPIEDA